jgi:hypothetical protein
MRLSSLDPDDLRALDVKVAGPAALLVAKLHKISDMLRDRPTALENKDSLDVYRLLQDVSREALQVGLNRLLSTPDFDIAQTANEALGYLGELFGEYNSPGARMAASAVGLLADPETVAASCAALAQDLLDTSRAEGS